MKEFDYDTIKVAGLNLTNKNMDFNNRRSRISLWVKEILQMAKKTFVEDSFIKAIEIEYLKRDNLINENVEKYNTQIKKEGPYNFGNYFGESESQKILNEMNSQLNQEVFSIIELCSIVDANSTRKQTNKIQSEKNDEKLTINENVFIVHGHNNELKQVVARTLIQLKFNPIILHENADCGNTIIEKFEEHASKASYAIILLSDDDLGKAKQEVELKLRARQNVIMELGYFLGKLGRNKVFVLKQGEVEVPSDIIGVVYNNYDGEEGGWRNKLVKNMKAVGFDVDANNL